MSEACPYCGRQAEAPGPCSDLCQRQLTKIEERSWARLTASWFSGDPLDSSTLARLIAQEVPEANQRARFEAWIRKHQAARHRRQKARQG